MAANEVVGVVLAAGESRRMGEPKALLEVGDGTFLGRCVSTLRDGGCARVVAVVASDDVAAAAEAADALVAWNRSAGSEQVDSLLTGLRAAGDASAAVVLPVDHPLVLSATVRALIAAHRAAPRAIVRPVLRGLPGHPTLFPRGTWPALRSGDLPRGARSLVEAPETETVDVAVEDDGIAADIDTPEEYRTWVDRA